MCIYIQLETYKNFTSRLTQTIHETESTHVYTYTHIYTRIYTYIHVYTDIYPHICIYIYLLSEIPTTVYKAWIEHRNRHSWYVIWLETHGIRNFIKCDIATEYIYIHTSTTYNDVLNKLWHYQRTYMYIYISTIYIYKCAVRIM